MKEEALTVFFFHVPLSNASSDSTQALRRKKKKQKNVYCSGKQEPLYKKYLLGFSCVPCMLDTGDAK